MIKTYYRSEYNGKQWVKLIDEALKLRCRINYSIYGNSHIICVSRARHRGAAE